MPKTEEKTLTDLLNEWAELEPGWCQVIDRSSEGTTFELNSGTELVGNHYGWTNGELGHVQNAVQRAIEERGWEWQGGSQLDEKVYAEPYWANVVTGIRTTSDSAMIMRECQGRSFPHALLAAYLKALRSHD